MARFTCGHDLPKGRVGMNLAHVPRDSSNRCPSCQTKTPSGVIGLLRNLQKPATALALAAASASPGKSPTKSRLSRDANSSVSMPYLVTFALDGFASQRKTAAFRTRQVDVLAALGDACLALLDRGQLASFWATARGRWGVDVGRLVLRAVAQAALRSCLGPADREPVRTDIVHALNDLVEFVRERGAVVDTPEQLDIVLDGAARLSKLRDDIAVALEALEDGFGRWEAAGK
ncbi:hypothetical protein GGR52DRAFT_592414 [Hypoxylon sp. FL1284]|nr:hypothetical protein GGR52DRAFT_592414 [Hypoxylon sp. FL1284]